MFHRIMSQSTRVTSKFLRNYWGESTTSAHFGLSMHDRNLPLFVEYDQDDETWASVLHEELTMAMISFLDWKKNSQKLSLVNDSNANGISTQVLEKEDTPPPSSRLKLNSNTLTFSFLPINNELAIDRLARDSLLACCTTNKKESLKFKNAPFILSIDLLNSAVTVLDFEQLSSYEKMRSEERSAILNLISYILSRNTNIQSIKIHHSFRFHLNNVGVKQQLEINQKFHQTLSIAHAGLNQSDLQLCFPFLNNLFWNRSDNKIRQQTNRTLVTQFFVKHLYLLLPIVKAFNAYSTLSNIDSATMNPVVYSELKNKIDRHFDELANNMPAMTQSEIEEISHFLLEKLDWPDTVSSFDADSTAVYKKNSINPQTIVERFCSNIKPNTSSSHAP